MIGHNNGPTMEAGFAYRRHVWGKARKKLLPRLPIEVIRYRLRRAEEIGLDYKTYATVRATTGRDIVAFLFSTNALRLFRADQAMEQPRRDKLAGLRGVNRQGLAVAGLDLRALMEQHGDVLDRIAKAPDFHASWAEAAMAMDAARPAKMPADAILMVGDTAMEREWAQAGRLAGYLSADRFFTNPG